MSELFFDAPWWLIAATAATGIIVFIWGNNRLRKDARYGGLGLVALAIFVALLSWVVETPREQVSAANRRFVQAVVDQDADALSELLDRRAVAYLWGRQQIVDGACFYARQTHLGSARIVRLDVELQPHGAVSHLSVWSQHSGGGDPPITDLNSQWKLSWRKDEDAWRIDEIVPLRIGQFDRQFIEGNYLSRSPGR